MKRLPASILILAVLLASCPTSRAAQPAPAGDAIGETGAAGAKTARFTPLLPLSGLRIIGSAEAYPGGNYNVENMIDGVADGSHRSEYSSAGRGVETFIDFDFGKPTRIAGFRHVDRFDIATVKAAELIFSNEADFGKVIARVKVDHANTRGGKTFVSFPPAVARYVRWDVTAVKQHGTVGGSEIGFFTAAAPEATAGRTTVEVTAFAALVRRDGKLLQPFEATIHYPYAEAAEATFRIATLATKTLRLRPGSHSFEFFVPAVQSETPAVATLEVAGRSVARSRLRLGPVRPWVLYFLPHSHVDIGYTHVQTEVLKMQWSYLEQAIELARRTADYPPGAQLKWNAEVLWAVDGYLEQASSEKQEEFVEAVKKGWIGLDGLYGNELTALCRPEELMRLVDCARRLRREHGLEIDSAMISDVPGYSWGIVPVLAQSGIKYLSMGPNHAHRIGYTLAEWGDKPFWWVSPSGRQKVLCWMAGHGYSWFHGGLLGKIGESSTRPILEYLNELSASGYPYDMVQLRYSIGGDNGPPDANLSEFVKQFNARYVHPKMVIATTSEMFHEFERRWGDKVPEVRGDFTPYWEDGAASSARETSTARTASERLVQAEAIWAMIDPKGYPADDFYRAWRNVLLYNEHTWGAHCSISRPDDKLTEAQWKIKRSYALDAGLQSCRLLAAATVKRKSSKKQVSSIDVFNTASWARTDLMVLPAEALLAGSAVTDAEGRPVPAQRLSTGQLVFMAKDVPPLGAKRFFFAAGEAAAKGTAKAEGTTLGNRWIRLKLDEKTGAIASFRCEGIPVDLVRRDSGLGLNDYFYVPGRDPKTAQRNAEVTISVQEPGPLLASLRIESHAPGCRRLTRRLYVVDGIDRLDIVNVVDKEPIRAKESVHFGFAFNVPSSVMRMDVPWAVVRPERDQLPGGCKNYFTVGRWVDVSNAEFGVTWATVDAPLVEVGRITVDVLPDPMKPKSWIKDLEPSATLYSYVMNNYWETNYKAQQKGPTRFRYSIRPHGRFDPAAATRFGIEQSQPLMAVRIEGTTAPRESLLRVEPAAVIVSSLKPSEDGKAWIVRLFNAGDKAARAIVSWADPAPSVSISSPLEEEGPQKLGGPIDLPAYGIVTLRASLPE